MTSHFQDDNDDVILRKGLRLHHFTLDWYEICHACSSGEYALMGRVGFRIWHHTFKR